MMNALEHLERYVSGHINLARTLLSLIKCEARLAGQSIVPLVVTTCMLFVILLSIWCVAMIMAGYYLLLFSGSFILSCGLLMAFNILILIILINYFMYNLNNMSFVHTREFFSKNRRMDHELTKKDESDDCVAHQAIKQPANPGTEA